ncbi:PrpF domain-containing protein [Halocatena salina]|nr:PrpF domain-containing protein [Halocatena salina]
MTRDVDPANIPGYGSRTAARAGSQEHLKCALVRGGTSKGMLIRGGDLPLEHQDEAILSVFGSHEPRQVDGIGGATSTTSKLMIVSPSSRPTVDIEYTFGQVGVKEAMIDYGGNCGNMTTAIGPFAYDEGMLEIPEESTLTEDPYRLSLTLFNTNTETRLTQTFPVNGRRALTEGSFSIHGVPGTGARVDTTFHDPSRTKTGALYPLGGPTTTLETSTGSVEATVLDVTTPVVFVRAEALGLTGTERPDDIDNDSALLERIEEIRSVACSRLGIVTNAAQATHDSPGFPKLAFVTEPQSYETDTDCVKATEIDLTARIMSMQYLHPIYAVTGAGCTAAATRLPGTIPNQVATDTTEEVAIGHPQGIMTVTADVEAETVNAVTVSRTQRRLMEGNAFYTL